MRPFLKYKTSGTPLNLSLETARPLIMDSMFGKTLMILSTFPSLLTAS